MLHQHHQVYQSAECETKQIESTNIKIIFRAKEKNANFYNVPIDPLQY